jgi:two-component system NtrC family sensor kinase
MGRVASSLAHEIKNPLQAIQNNLSLVMDFPLDPEERNGCLRICRDEVERLTEITQRMLSFARTERQTVHPISIPQVWKETAALLRPSLGKSAVRMATTFPADLPMAMGVADQISQVLLNLALNSIEAMPGGGNIHIVASAQDDQVLVTLTNDGPPIPEEHLEHLFEPFFTTKPEGTGLGLFICHNIVQQHGGSLSVENLRDKAGVMYTLTLPAAPGHPLYTLASSEGSRS